MYSLKQSKISIKSSLLLLSCYLSLSFLTGCDQDFTLTSSNMDTRLSVELGPDITANVDDSVKLTSYINSSYSSAVTYQWVQTSGNSISLTEDSNSYLEFTAAENDTLEFNLIVTDSEGMEYTDSITVTVLAVDDSIQYNVKLSWTAPTENEDSSSLTNLAGYKIYYGQSVTNMDTLIAVNDPLQTSADINNLDVDHSYFFCMTAYNSTGLESQCSDVVDIIL